MGWNGSSRVKVLASLRLRVALQLLEFNDADTQFHTLAAVHRPTGFW